MRSLAVGIRIQPQTKNNPEAAQDRDSLNGTVEHHVTVSIEMVET